MYPVIGFSGKIGSGKDSAATFLMQAIEKYDLPEYTRYAFARPLKEASSFMFGWTMDQIEDRTFKEAVDPEWGFTPRRAMQLLGTEFGRALKPTLWLDFASKALKRSREDGWAGLIVTDVRFENEAQWIRDQGGLLIHVTREEDTKPKTWFRRLLDKLVKPKVHASEIMPAFVEGDFKIYNTKSLEALKEKMEWVAQTVLK